MLNQTNPQSLRHWLLLGLATLTGMLVFGMPNLSLPVLFDEIASDLNLSLVELGFIWGITYFVAIFVGLVGGSLGDRFGTRRTLTILCILSGITGAARVLSTDFTGLLITSFLWGITLPGIPVHLHKVAGQWFPARQLGLANSIISMGFALGMLLGSFLAASFLSPLLGGWRNVLLVYALIAILIGIFWLVLHPSGQAKAKKELVPLKQGLTHVVRLKNVWIIGLGASGITGCFLGVTGYLPTYLKTAGWPASTADQALSMYFLFSLLGVIPLSLLADKLASRRLFLMIVAVLMASGAVLFSLGSGLWVWIAVILSGLMFDAYMSVYTTAVMEVKGVGARYTGTALGCPGTGGARHPGHQGGAIARPRG